MMTKRWLLSLPLLLGSCMITPPTTNIYVVTSTPQEHQSEPAATADTVAPMPVAPPSIDPAATCNEMALNTIKSYHLPAKPNLNGIDPTDSAKIADALVENIKILRIEIIRLQKEYICTLERMGARS